MGCASPSGAVVIAPCRLCCPKPTHDSASVQSDLPLTFSYERISTHAGLELFGRFFNVRDVAHRLGEAFRKSPLDSALPADRTAVRWLRSVTAPLLEGLADPIRNLVRGAIARHGLYCLTLDVDGKVVRTGAKAEGDGRQILHVWKRPGTVVDSHNADGFLRIVDPLSVAPSATLSCVNPSSDQD